MHKLVFQIEIASSVSHVYKTMLAEESYRVWTSEFNPTSRYVGSWEKGAKILFVGEDASGLVGGMVSRIAENIPEQLVSIEHLGVLHGDAEITEGPEVVDWAGAKENYSFKDINGKTLLTVEMDANEDFETYLRETWPKALEKLKSICE